MLLAEAVPDFVAELSAALNAAGNPELGQEFAESTVSRFTYDPSSKACYISLQPSRPLNVVESNVIGAKHGRTLAIDHPFWVYVDVDNFNRPMGIELLNASSILVQRLSALTA